MTGGVTASPSSGMAQLDSGRAIPGRYDRFLSSSSAASVVSSCVNPTDLFAIVTSGGLRFLDPSASGTSFGLYSPSPYEEGSSIYHHDPKRLATDCSKLSIASADCSDLMTQSLPNGYTQRSVGEPVRRMMLSLLGMSIGLGPGVCAL
jgi:hypothetical protein